MKTLTHEEVLGLRYRVPDGTVFTVEQETQLDPFGQHDEYIVVGRLNGEERTYRVKVTEKSREHLTGLIESGKATVVTEDDNAR